MAEVISKDENFRCHHGRLGGFVEDDIKQLFGITCRHVTQMAYDGFIYVRSKHRGLVKFGETMVRSKPYEIEEDIDLILIDDKMVSVCDFSTRNTKGIICLPELFTGPMETLFSQQVFLRVKNSAIGESLSSSVVFCKIAPYEIHKSQQCLDVNKNFLIQTSELIQPGHSGNIIFKEYDDGTLLLVGLILGGKYLINKNEYVLCLRLDHGTKVLEETFNKKLFLPKTDQVVATRSKNDIQVGICIWIMAPEDIAKSDFVLFEHLIMLMDCFGVDECSAKSVKLENEFEEQLSEYVNSRINTLHVLPVDTTDQRCFLECMIGCEYLYSGNFDKADEHLKDAVRLIAKTSCRNRLLCKLITYSTWQQLRMKKLHNMRELLEEGERYMLKMKDLDVCPLKSVGYHYFDYARYYKEIKNFEMAMGMARKSLEYFELDERRRGKPSHGKCFALSTIAGLNLNCGDMFETRNNPMLNLKEAEECIVDMKSFRKELPAVEMAAYLLVKTDLHFRRGEIENAAKSARKCRKIAIQNNLHQDKNEADVRIKELSSILTTFERPEYS